MLQAAKHFDPNRGFRLATYAMWWIRAAILEYIIHSRSLVKIGTTQAQRKLFFNLHRLKGQIQAIDDGELSPEAVTKIAAALGVPEGEVVSMDQRLGAPDYSLNSPVQAAEGVSDGLTLLADDAPDQETIVAERAERQQRRHLVRGALRHLDSRERDIILERHFRVKPRTFDELSGRYAVSRERIRQIEERALDKMRRSVRSAMIVGLG